MTPDWLNIWFDIAGMVGGLVSITTAGVWFIVRHTRVSRAEFQAFIEEHSGVHGAIETRLQRGDQHFTRLETDAGHVPSHGELDAIRLSLAEMKGDLRSVASNQDNAKDRMERMEQNIDRIIEYQLRGAAR